MIFALWDYLLYRQRKGRYSRRIERSPMAAAWENGIPEHIVDLLSDGDMLLFLSFGYFPAWMIMYATSSDVSHIAIYCTGRRVAHMTTSGLTVEPLSNCFDSNTRLLPIHFEIPKSGDTSVEEFMNSVENRAYGWVTVIKKGIKIASGRHWHYFRWKFFVDISILIELSDLPLQVLFQTPVLAWLIPFYFLMVLFHAVLWRWRPLSPDNDNGAPVDGLSLAMAGHGTIIGDAYAVRGQPHGGTILRKVSKSADAAGTPNEEG